MVTGLLMISARSVMAEDICYAVADNDYRPNSADMLVMMYSDGGTMIVGEGTGTEHLEAIAFSPDGTKLYAADAGQFGELNLMSGSFMLIGSGFGSGSGSEGVLPFDDVDGLAFDAAGTLYATVRREHGSTREYDLLIQVNPATGEAIPGAFGGDDYVVVTVIDYPQYYDVDDLATDPSDGTLYAIMNTGDGVETVLVTLDKATGDATKIELVNESGEVVDDIESLSFNTSGTVLYGTTGNGGANKGNADPPTKGILYQINPADGTVVVLGKLLPPTGMEEAMRQQDFEAVSCITDGFNPPKNTCVMYALHDEGLNDSQVIEIDPETNVIRPLGPMYHGLDLEALALLHDGKLYSTSGYHSGKTDLGLAFGQDGHVYDVERGSGLVTPIGSTDYSEVSGLALDPTTGEMYGWARGVNKDNRYEKDPVTGKNDKTKPKVGLIKINPATGASELIVRAEYKNPDIEGIAMTNDGKKVYGTAYNDLWVIDLETKTMSIQCEDMFDAEVEAVEMQPNDLLLFGTDGKQEIAILAYDPETCQVVASRSFKNTIYDDIESIEWPAHECNNESWLNESSGDVVIELIEYQMVSEDVVSALEAALEASGLVADLEVDDDVIFVYIDDMVFTAKVVDGSQVKRRSGRSSDDDDDAPSVKAELVTLDGELGVKTADGTVFSLQPQIAGSAEDVEIAVGKVEGVKSVQVVDDEIAVVIMEDGGKIEAKVSLVSSEAQVEVGESLQQVEPTVECTGSAECYCEMTYSDTMSQCFTATDAQ